jgi:hypothetical protein
MENGRGIHLVLVELKRAHAQLLEHVHAQHLIALLIRRQAVLQKLKASRVAQQLHGIAEQILAQHLLLLLTKLAESHAFLGQYVQQLHILAHHRFLVNE